MTAWRVTTPLPPAPPDKPRRGWGRARTPPDTGCGSLGSLCSLSCRRGWGGTSPCISPSSAAMHAGHPSWDGRPPSESRLQREKTVNDGHFIIGLLVVLYSTSHRYPFCVFFNESRRTKVPKPYSKESMSSGTFKDISQSDRPRTRSVKTKNKHHRQRWGRERQCP